MRSLARAYPTALGAGLAGHTSADELMGTLRGRTLDVQQSAGRRRPLVCRAEGRTLARRSRGHEGSSRAIGQRLERSDGTRAMTVTASHTVQMGLPGTAIRTALNAHGSRRCRFCMVIMSSLPSEERPRRVDEHVEVQATWHIYQRMIGAYREPARAHGRDLMVKLIESVSQGVPAALTEVITLGRTLKKRAADVLAYFDRPGTSNGPTEAINGRLEHLRGSALGFRNLTNYIARSPTRSRRIQTPTTPSIVKSPFEPVTFRFGRDRRVRRGGAR